MATGKSSGKRCSECGTEHTEARGQCEPLEERRGPDVTSPDHPSNNGAWRRVLDTLRNHGLPA
jgi:hypothetical protein